MSPPTTQCTARPAAGRLARRLERLYAPLFATALPVALTSPLWLELWRGTRPRATNGSGHYAIAQLYARAIFPDTFGWTDAYFGGMPFPNFYPPLFYWLVAALTHTRLVSFDVAFKLVTALPLLLLPAAIWTLAWFVAHRDRAVANCAAFASLLLLFVPQFQLKTVAGLDYFSTLVVGLYTQPLGFVLLLGWYVSYLGAHRRRWRFAAASVLLTLNLLANFFNAATAAVLILAVAANDLWRLGRARGDVQRAHARHALFAHLASPLASALVALFWLAPLLRDYGYVVTRPFIIPLGALIPRPLLAWYALAACGLALGLRRAGRGQWAYSLACLALGCGIVCSGTLAPRWFPLQSYRFLSTLNFLLAVPVGLTLATCGRRLKQLVRRSADRLDPAAQRPAHVPTPRRSARSILFSYAATFGTLVLVATTMAKVPARTTLTFYQHAENEQIGGVLNFAASHRDGRYLVELPDPQTAYTEAGYDSRALSAYLGLQGNAALGTIFRESSPNVLFVNPQTAAFSTHPDSHGISSVLGDDEDFAAQPLATHLARARQLGTKYLVVATPAIKERLRAESDVAGSFDLGAWSVFELRGAPPAPVRALQFRPALYVGPFSLKGRRREDAGFVRFAEEQFADNWFDVLLTRSPEPRLDRLSELDEFGALVVETYDCADEDAAYTRLRAYAQRRALVLLASDAPLYRRIERTRAEFPRAVFVTAHTPVENSPWVETLAPSYHYDASARRQQWRAIRRALAENKVAVAAHAGSVSGGASGLNSLRIDVAGDPTERVPVLIDTTFHPGWRRADNGAIYAATPFAMLTFVDHPVDLTYARRPSDRLALYASAGALVALCGFAGWPGKRSLISTVRQLRVPRFARWTTAKRFIGD